MFTLDPLALALLAVLCAIAAFTDMRERRIPNWLVASGLALGFVLNLFLYSTEGLKNAGYGLGLAMLIYLPLFVLRGMGAGDVKLMAAIGAIVGPGNWLRIFIFTAVMGGFVAILFILYRGALGSAMKNIGRILMSSIRGQAPYQNHPELDVTSGKGMSLPHGAIIALGAYLFIFLNLA